MTDLRKRLAGGMFASWVMCQLVALAVGQEASNTGTSAKRQPSRITIARETTFHVSPVDDDGYVDYITIKNATKSEGITHENNAAVLYCRAIGLEPWRYSKVTEQYFEKLDVEPPPEVGDYLIDDFHFYLNRYGAGRRPLDPGLMDELVELERQVADVLSGAWSRERFPLIAAWIDANLKPLEIYQQASMRPKFYSPVVVASWDSHSGMAEIMLGAKLLVIRAMMQLESGSLDSALGDLMTVHRAARHVAQHPSMVGRGVSSIMEEIAINGEIQIATSSRFDEAFARKMADELGKLPPLPTIAASLDATRCEQLEMVNFLCGDPTRVSDGMMFLDPLSPLLDEPKTFVNWIPFVHDFDIVREVCRAQIWMMGNRAIDWDTTCRIINRWYDEANVAVRLPTHSSRERAFRKLRTRLQQWRLDLTAGTTLLDAIRQRTAQRIAFNVVDIVSADRHHSIETRGAVWIGLRDLAIAIGLYRASHGSYPSNLSSLQPEFISALPNDPITGEPFRYRRSGDGFLLYSVGFDREDESGPFSDNIAIEVPRKSENE